MVHWAITKRPLALVGLNMVAAACYLLIGWRTGSLTHIDAGVFSTPDSHTYREVADWIFGARSSSPASMYRPFFYPLLLGLADRAAGTVGVWLLNVLLWFGALNLAAIAAYRFVKNAWVAAIVFLLLATNISLILLTFQALTETTTIALMAWWTLGLSMWTRSPSPWTLISIALPVSLLLVVKPEFELLLAITLLVLLAAVWRGRSRIAGAAALAASLVPVILQVGLMLRVNHYFGISDIGGSTIRGYYLPRLFVYMGMSPDVYSGRDRAIPLSDVAVAQFVASHSFDSLRVFASILKGNLESTSNFLTGSNPILVKIDTWSNEVFALVLALMIPIVAVALWRTRDLRLALLSVGVINVMLAGGLSFWQGDRLTIVALPLWAVALAVAGKHIADWMQHGQPARAEDRMQLVDMPGTRSGHA